VLEICLSERNVVYYVLISSTSYVLVDTKSYS